MGEISIKTEVILDILVILMKYPSTSVYLYTLAYFWGGIEGTWKIIKLQTSDLVHLFLLVLLSPWAPFLFLILPSSTLLSYLTKYIFNISKCFEVQLSVHFGALRSYSVMCHVISILEKNARLSPHLKQDLQGFGCTPERDGGRQLRPECLCSRQAGRKENDFPRSPFPSLISGCFTVESNGCS